MCSFLQKCKELKTKIREVEKLKELEEPFGQWIAFFDQKQSGLSALEKEYLAGTLQNGKTGMATSDPNEDFELECINGPAFILGSMTYKSVTFDYTYLNDYTFLPSNKFHHAVLSGSGLSFWYRKILIEYYAYLTLECPQVRGFELKDIDSGEVISAQETLRLESNQSVTVGHNGIFKPLTVEDTREDGPFYLHGIGFRNKEKISRFFSEMVKKYKDAYNWELPLLNPSSIILPPNEAPMVDFKSDEEKFSIKLESLDGKPRPFNLSISIRTNSLGFDAIIPAILEVTCPILVDVLMIDRNHFLDIQFGESPYNITWSNGISGELSQTLTPGNYDVKVTDANGCERTVEFTMPEFGTVEDIDGNVYETVEIGNTWWMAENLRTTRKRDGTAILHLPSNEEWINSGQTAFSWRDNTKSHDETFGKLYNYAAACCDICPTDWRLPGISEITELTGEFGRMNAARALRALNAWPDGSLKSTNLSGLSFLPAGFRVGRDGVFSTGKPFATFWTNFVDPYGFVNLVLLQGSVDYKTTTIATSLRDGYSVRCVKE
nr:hypothetical protein [Cytophagales bacterium]